ncbi:hypothetical protein Gasu2_47850 [Galdieria sulphuraria]|nr:hypothetical protein Gasu2_47850 [Galdieria sulphuraria]
MYSSRWNVTLGATICHAFFIGLVYILPSVILSSGCYWIDMLDNQCMATYGLGTAIGLVLSGFSLAGVLFPVGLGTLLEWFGWRTTVFFSFLFFVLIIVPLAYLTLQQGTLVSSMNEDTASSSVHHSINTNLVSATDFKSLLLSPSFWLLGFEYFSLAYSQSFPFDYLVTYLHEDASFTYEKATIFLSIMNACAVVSKLLGGIIGDYSSRFKTLLASSFLMLMGVLCLLQRQSTGKEEKPYWTMTNRIGQLVSFSILFGLGSGSLWNNLYALVPFYIGTGHLGFSQNSLSALHYLGSAIGSMMGGIVKTQTGSFTIDIVGIAAVCFLNLLVALYLTWQQQMSLSNTIQVEYSTPNDEME